MKEITEVSINYCEDQNLHRIDVCFDGNDQSQTIGVYDFDTHKVIFFDNSLRDNVQIKKALDEKLKETNCSYIPQFPNTFSCWHETHFEIVSAIHSELCEDELRGVVAEVQEAQGHGGLYELAEDLTTEFETKNKGIPWGEEVEFFEEIEKFIDLKLYHPEKEYQPSYK